MSTTESTANVEPSSTSSSPVHLSIEDSVALAILFFFLFGLCCILHRHAPRDDDTERLLEEPWEHLGRMNSDRRRRGASPPPPRPPRMVDLIRTEIEEHNAQVRAEQHHQ